MIVESRLLGPDPLVPRTRRLQCRPTGLPAWAAGALVVVGAGFVGCGPGGDVPPSQVPADEATREPFDHSALRAPSFAGLEVSSSYVEMSDGVRLAVDVYLPVDGPESDGFPTIFRFTPYQRSAIHPSTGDVRDLRSSGDARFFVSRGYAMVVADMRGTGASEGWLMEFMPRLGDDGRELVDWIAAQPWSDGNVGMSGASYLGWAQTATASRRPAALRCIAPAVIPLEGWTGEIYPGGIFAEGFVELWAGLMRPLRRNEYHPRVGQWPALPVVDEDGDGELHDEIPLDTDASGSFLDDGAPTYRDGVERDDVYFYATQAHIRNLDHAEATRDRHFIDEPLGLGLDPRALGSNAHVPGVSASAIPIYHFGGWFAGSARGTLELFATLEPTNPQKIAMLPAYHVLDSGPFWRQQGIAQEEVRNLLRGEHLRFFDRHLRGMENGLEDEPPLALFVMNGGGLRFENEWPLEREVPTRLFMSSAGLLETAREGNGADPYDVDFSHDSSYGSNGSNRWTAIAGNVPDDLPWRSRQVSKTLAYQTATLEAPLEVTGHPLIHLVVSSTSDTADVFVYLEDVDPEGRALLVTEAQHRAGFSRIVDNDSIVSTGEGPVIDVEPELPWHGYERRHFEERPFAEGRRLKLLFDFQPTSWVFLEGHRIRVSIAAVDHPTFRIDPGLSSSNDPESGRNRRASLTVHRSRGAESWIELPVIPPEPGSRDEDVPPASSTTPDVAGPGAESVPRGDDVRWLAVE